MEDINNEQLDNQIDSNDVVSGIHFIANHLEEQREEIEEKKISSKNNLLIL